MELYRSLPKVDVVLADPRLDEMPHEVAVWATREVLDELRSRIRSGVLRALPDVVEAVQRRAAYVLDGRLRRVINATGIVVHTNLGRAPWHPEAVRAAVDATGYCNLEMDLESGKRGGRLDGLGALMRQLTGCEAALVVNNCAAAVLLALTALGRDREVVVSRSELVEIGGSFRVPDVISSGGARLVEVGTTNRTRAADYGAAIGSETAILLRVHASNFKIVGFTEEADRDELVALGRHHGVYVVEDIGSGSLDGENGEPSVRAAVRSGVDVALFSGDKLLGGPQCGIAVGRTEAISRLRRHPLYRALRVDKVTLAALEATLAIHARGGLTRVDQMLKASDAELAERADRLHALLVERGVRSAVRASDEGFVGGGARPGDALRAEVVAVPTPHPSRVARALRTGSPAVVARVARDTVRFDSRTLTMDELDDVATRVASVLREG